MFASRLTDFDIVDATPYHNDPLKALADACHEQKIKLFFYYSLLDWHHPDYFPLGKTGKTAGREQKGDWSRYVAYYQGQVRELCTNYGEIGGIWFDGWWDKPDADWDLAGTYRLIHELQPACLGRKQSSCRSAARRGFSNLRAGPAGRERRRIQQGQGRRRTAAGNLHDDQPIVGVSTPATRTSRAPKTIIHALDRIRGKGRESAP